MQTKASLLRILLKNVRALHALEDLEPLFKFFYPFCKNFPGTKSRQSTATRPPKLVSKILCYAIHIFFQNSRFTEIIRH